MIVELCVPVPGGVYKRVQSVDTDADNFPDVVAGLLRKWRGLITATKRFDLARARDHAVAMSVESPGWWPCDPTDECQFVALTTRDVANAVYQRWLDKQSEAARVAANSLLARGMSIEHVPAVIEAALS